MPDTEHAHRTPPPMHPRKRPSRRAAPAARRAALLALVLFAGCTPSLASDLLELARIHAVSGREQAAAEYVRRNLPKTPEIDNTGSLTVTFGSGAPHTLLTAGLDEPGYVVSRVDEDGYLRLQRLCDPAPHYDFDTFFLGQAVRIGRPDAAPLTGVVAAPSVHFDASRSYSSRSEPADLFIDIGAVSARGAFEAGVDVLQPVSLEKEPFALADGVRLTGPWISARAGAAVLLDLARRMETSPPPGTVTLAFVSQQYFHNRGLLRVLQRVPADRVVLIQPGGEERPSLTAVSGWSTEVLDSLLEHAASDGIDFERTSSRRLETGPFGPQDPWPKPEHSVLLTVGVENAGTPVEVVSTRRLEEIAKVLGRFCGISPGEPASKRPAFHSAGERLDLAIQPDSHNSVVKLMEALIEIPGVSGGEERVRDAIRDALPPWARERASVDKKGNLIVRLGGNGPVQTVFIAHMDEIGFRVSRVSSDGEITAETVGGGTASLFAWHPVVLHGSRGPLRGIMTRHGVVDIGAESEENARSLGVEADAAITVPKKLRRLLGRRVNARSLDDRIGCAVLLSVIQSVHPTDQPLVESGKGVWLVLSVEEEIGLLGAESVAGRTGTARVFAVDSFVTSDSPLEDKRIAHAPLGKGFVIRAMDNSGISPQRAVRHIVELARSSTIPVQYGVTAGGNDGSKFVPAGAVNVPLSWPLRYAHTPAEVADLRDVEALEAIVRKLVLTELAGETTY